MPTNTPCPKCGMVGYARFERVIKGSTSIKVWYCGRCEYEWREADPTPSPRPAKVSAHRRLKPRFVV